MMVVMHRSPFNDTTLTAGLRPDGQYPLKDAACFERPVRKITMITRGDKKDPDDVKHKTCDDARPGNTRQEGAEGKEMQDGKIGDGQRIERFRL